jgi:uncharacterized membrane protein (DUF4010 family)
MCASAARPVSVATGATRGTSTAVKPGPHNGAMVPAESTIVGLAVALGGGLLIGIERERRKGAGPRRALAGVRTFALAALAGAAARALGEPLLLAAGAALIAVLACIAYWRDRSRDPGVTTELALLVTYLLGVMAIAHPIVAAGGSVVVTALLASRRTLHAFSVDTLTEMELRDGLVFAAAALILLPLLPDQPMQWAIGANPRRLWGLVVLFMALQAAGYVASRAAGVRLGLAVSGLAAGFVSSTGTIAALGARARVAPSLRPSCIAGALCSTVATVLLLAVVVLAVCPAALPALAPSLLAALIAAGGVAGFSVWRQPARSALKAPGGRAFSLWYAIGFAAILTAATATVSLAERFLGQTAASVATAIAGGFDVHAAAASTLSLAAAGKLSVTAVRLPVLVAYSANALTKLVAGFVGGGRLYGAQVGLGLVGTVGAAWLALLLFG